MPTQSYPHTATIVNTVVAPPCEPPSYVRRRRRRPVVGRIRKAMSRSFQAYTSSLLVEMPLDWGASSQCKDHDHKHAHHSEASADRAVFLQDTFCIRGSSAAAAEAATAVAAVTAPQPPMVAVVGTHIRIVPIPAAPPTTMPTYQVAGRHWRLLCACTTYQPSLSFSLFFPSS